MNCVFIIPTGIGCEIGGHAGDATPAAKLIASVCNKLIIHPNVVNASDINEMTGNMLYVEGSTLDRFLEGKIGLREGHSNKILVAVNSPAIPETINAVSAARTTIGADIEIMELKTPLEMIARMEFGVAAGDVNGWQELLEQVKEYNFDALAIITRITTENGVEADYFENGGVNPWGGVEAKASGLISGVLNKPVAHAPFEPDLPRYNKLVDPRMGAEIVSNCFMHCVLKGLHRAPRIGSEITVGDIDCLISPYGCVGRPHRACMDAGIPIIAVRENRTVLNDPIPESFIVVDNYLEACGVVSAMNAGVTRESVRRPIPPTHIKEAL